MKRMTLVLMATIVALVTTSASVSARTIEVRTDPNDTHGLDIRKVWSNVGRSGVFLRIGAWERLRRYGVGVILDTTGTPDFDRIVEISGGHPSCVVEELNDGFLGDFIGRRPGSRGPRAVACHLPTGWFHIRKTVGFVVLTGTAGSPHADRAPNRGRYLGL